jgi:hypothetical protein
MDQRSGDLRVIAVGGKKLRATPVFDTYWKFAAARQEVYEKRMAGAPPPWTDDPIIAGHRFTNAYRASDRVSQYLIRNVICSGTWSAEETFFRVLMFKIFNRIETWELLRAQFDEVSWSGFRLAQYARVLDQALERDQRLYSAAYIMPSPAFGFPRKHRNHLELLQRMMKAGLPAKVADARSMSGVYQLLLDQPSLGGFLAFQYTIDLNYSELIDFSEMDFVVAGPGARDGISKCFADTDGLDEAEVIKLVADMAESEFTRLGLNFRKLGGKRPLQLIDCQNLFCEVSKYARVAHPEWAGESGRTKIKQKFAANPTPMPPLFPPKWKLPPGSKTTTKRGVAKRVERAVAMQQT